MNNNDYNNYNNNFNGNNGNYNNGFDGYYNNNNFNNLSENTRNPNVPYEIYREYPDARIATKKDGKTELIISTIICILVFLIFGFLMFQSWLSISETDRIMNCNVTVEGTVTNTWSSLRSSGKSKRTVYFATYKYTYNNTEYKGTVETGISRYHKGYTVTVYVDPDKPYDSRLFRESKLIEYLYLIIMAPFVIFWFFALRKYILCCKGRMVIYKRKSTNGYRTVWKKIK